MKKLLLALVLFGCSNPPTPKAVELEFCNARAAYLLVSDGKLTPAPGSPRAKLEEAEDRFCATLAR